MHRGRYGSRRYGSHDRKANMFLRIFLSVAAALVISFLLIVLGKNLGSTVPEETEEESATTESVTSDVNRFHYKEIKPIRVADSSVANLTDPSNIDALLITISSEEGKLTFAPSVNDMLYGGGFSTTLSPVKSAIERAKQFRREVMIEFMPFEDADAQHAANAASLAVIESLAADGATDITLIPGKNTFETLKLIRESVRSDISVGVLVPMEVLDSEITLREYYSAFDYVVLDLTSLPYDIESEESESPSPDTESDSEAGETSGSEPEQLMTVREYITKHTLFIKKYSVRLKVSGDSADSVSKFIAIAEEFDIDSYVIG